MYIEANSKGIIQRMKTVSVFKFKESGLYNSVYPIILWIENGIAK